MSAKLSEEARIAKGILDDVRRNLDAIAKEKGITFESAPPDDAGPRCDACKGRGWVASDDVPHAVCGTCNGTGYPKSWAAQEIARLDAEIQALRIRSPGTPPGNLADRSTFMRVIQGQRESFERTRPLCSDHVDKMSGECLGCRIDRLKRELAREVSWGIAQMDFASRALAATLEGRAPPSDSYLCTAGIPDEKKIARFLLDTLTGGALSSLICAVRDTMIDGDRLKRPPSHWAHVENLKSNLRALGEDIP